MDGDVGRDWKQDRRLIACAIAVGLLLNSALRLNGDGFYTFLRIYVSGLAAGLALYDWRQKGIWVPVVAGLIAILFNPIRPIEMNRDGWFWYDIGAAGCFAVIGGWPYLYPRRRAWQGWALATLVLAAIGISALLSLSNRSWWDYGANNTMNVDENMVADESPFDWNAANNEMANADVALNADMNATPASDMNAAANEVSAGPPEPSAEGPGTLADTQTSLPNLREPTSRVGPPPQRPLSDAINEMEANLAEDANAD